MLNPEIRNFLSEKLDQFEDYRGGVRGCCPFHGESTPSFFVYFHKKAEGWFAKCFGCGYSSTLSSTLYKLRGGYLAEFVKIYSQPQARRKKVDEDIPYRTDSSLGYPPIYDYFLTRGISQQVCELFKFKTDLLVPAAVMPVYFDMQYVGYIKRAYGPDVPKSRRYIIEPGIDLEEVLWGWDYIDFEKPTVVTEGIIDAACWWSTGIQAVALIGKQWKRKYKNLSALAQPILLPDNNDEASLDSFYELAISLCCPTLLIPPDFKDTSDLKVNSPKQFHDFIKNPLLLGTG